MDGCNTFVYYGGIIDIVFLCLVLGAVVFKLFLMYENHKRSRSAGGGSIHVHVGAPPSSAPPSNEAIPDAALYVELQSHKDPIAKPHQPSGVALPNTEGSLLLICSLFGCSLPCNSSAGFILSGAGIESVNGVYWPHSPILASPTNISLRFDTLLQLQAPPSKHAKRRPHFFKTNSTLWGCASLPRLYWQQPILGHSNL